MRLLSVAQEHSVAPGQCVPPREPIYNSEKDKVKPPKFAISQAEQLPPEITGNKSLELVVNSEGRLCEVHILKTTDHDSAVQIATYVAKHWKFKPATHEGKPVSVVFHSEFARWPQQ